MNRLPYMLLVDDDPQVLTYMQEALEEAGYSLTATTSGTDALASIKERLPDLLILDLNMPEPDGFDILKTVRSQFPDLKILVISGYLTGVLLDAATVVGAIATIEKPFSSEALVAKVREVFGE